MKKTIIGVIVVVAALALGVGGACLAVRSLPQAAPIQNNLDDDLLPYYRQGRGGMMPFRNDPGFRQREGMGRGMMDRYWLDENELQGKRLTMDEALTRAQEYIADKGENLRVAEVMEFSSNFYAVVVESDTGKGAFELLVLPVSGRVIEEPGPNMMWNAKYGHMASGNPSAANTLSVKEAAALAQKALDARIQGAVVSEDGIDFYGYYSFDYEVNGKVAGMLSVNGESGRVWFHSWHGDFIAEKEIE